MLALVVIALSLLFLLLASFYDIKTTEVPDRLSVGLAVIVLFVSLVHSVYSSSYSHLAATFVVGAAYLAVGLVLFYLGQWGGGDVKMLAGVGCVLGYLNSVGYDWPNSTILPYYLTYFINMGLVAIPYLLVYTLVIGFRSRELFSEFLAETRRKTFLLVLILSVLPSAIALYFGLGSLSLSYLILPAFTSLSVYLKTSERVLFRKKVLPVGLKAGDVLAEDLIVDGVKLVSKSNMEGLTEEQLDEIRRLHKEGRITGGVTVKLGVIFVPIYPVAFVLTVWAGNPIELAVHQLL